MHEMMAAALAGDARKAIEINNRMLGLHKNLFLESNPIPVKWALHRMGRIAEGIRLPLTPFAPQYHETLASSLREAGCLA
jgi:4-hydroxy-tetrahydrodipicolinate synthase